MTTVVVLVKLQLLAFKVRLQHLFFSCTTNLMNSTKIPSTWRVGHLLSSSIRWDKEVTDIWNQAELQKLSLCMLGLSKCAALLLRSDDSVFVDVLEYFRNLLIAACERHLWTCRRTCSASSCSTFPTLSLCFCLSWQSWQLMSFSSAAVCRRFAGADPSCHLCFCCLSSGETSQLSLHPKKREENPECSFFVIPNLCMFAGSLLTLHCKKIMLTFILHTPNSV